MNGRRRVNPGQRKRLSGMDGSNHRQKEKEKKQKQKSRSKRNEAR
jgi:hypothetical protein